MFYRKVPDKNFETATLTRQGDASSRITGYGRAFFVPDMDRPNEIEIIFECAPDEADAIESGDSWLFEGVAGGDAGGLEYRVRVPVRFDKENASHTAPEKQLRLVWDGGDYEARPST